MNAPRHRRPPRPTTSPGGARAKARARRIERQLDALLWEVAAEPDLPAAPTGPAELGPERIARDVERWRQTIAPARTARPRLRHSWPHAAAAALVLCIAGAASYWPGSGPAPTTASAADTSARSDESWYAQVARGPDDRRVQGPQRDPRACSSESWYCVQVRPDSPPQTL